MSFSDISFKKLAIIMIAAGVVAVFAISGFQARNLFAPSVTEEAQVILKQGDKCIVEGSDRVPREIQNCPYNEGDTVLISYKPQQPSIERHEPRQRASK
ncbi:hypothetical protein [Nitrososphaera sp.]|uniref:hypothetical protein n=1 Tax=Nitrososphaera sp. TaxID=1971748 RepID=UPI00307CE6F1